MVILRQGEKEKDRRRWLDVKDSLKAESGINAVLVSSWLLQAKKAGISKVTEQKATNVEACSPVAGRVELRLAILLKAYGCCSGRLKLKDISKGYC